MHMCLQKSKHGLWASCQSNQWHAIRELELFAPPLRPREGLGLDVELVTVVQ